MFKAILVLALLLLQDDAEVAVPEIHLDGPEVELRLPEREFLSGLPTEFPIHIKNSLGVPISSLESKVSCACVGLRLPSRDLEDGGSFNATVLVRPSSTDVAQVVEVWGIENDSGPKRLFRFLVSGRVKLPFALDKTLVPLVDGRVDEGNASVWLKLHKGVQLTKCDISKDTDSIEATCDLKENRIDFRHPAGREKVHIENANFVFEFEYRKDGVVGKHVAQVRLASPSAATVFPAVVPVRMKNGVWNARFILTEDELAPAGMGFYKIQVIGVEGERSQPFDVEAKPLANGKYACYVAIESLREFVAGDEIKLEIYRGLSEKPFLVTSAVLQ